jgi:PAS domain S-box-containing protein
LIGNKKRTVDGIELIDKEIKVSPRDMLVSKTDIKGNIVYGNATFWRISQLDEKETLGKPHNVNRHPDMPKAVFKLMWDTIKGGNNFRGVVKNKAVDGRYYWVITDFNISRNADGSIKNYMAFRQRVEPRVRKVIEPIYKRMLDIERKSGMEKSGELLESFLEEKGTDYSTFIAELTEQEKNKSLLGKIIGKFID